MGKFGRTWDDKGGLTERDIADKLKITVQAVRCYEQRGVRKLWQKAGKSATVAAGAARK